MTIFCTDSRKLCDIITIVGRDPKQTFEHKKKPKKTFLQSGGAWKADPVKPSDMPPREGITRDGSL